MQPDRFTIRSQEAVAEAQRLAAERRNPEVASAHLLIALLEQEDGAVVPILQKLGADLGAVAAGARDAAERLPRLSGEDQAEARPSSALVRTLQRAEKEMQKLGDEYISTEHILLALSDRGSGVSELLPDPRLAWQRRSPSCADRTGSLRPTPRKTSRRWRNSAAT